MTHPIEHGLGILIVARLDHVKRSDLKKLPALIDGLVRHEFIVEVKVTEGTDRTSE